MKKKLLIVLMLLMLTSVVIACGAQKVQVAQPTYDGPALVYGQALPAITTTTKGGTVALNAGQTLTVGTKDYQWTFVPEDKKTTFTNTTGTISLTVGKASQTLSGELTVSLMGDVASVSVSNASGASLQYRIDEEAWQDSPDFAGLTIGDTYTFYARIKENDNYHASDSISKEITLTEQTLFIFDARGALSGITAYGKTLKSIHVPEIYEGKYIDQIAADAFAGCNLLEDLTFDGYLEIERGALRGLNTLKSLRIPKLESGRGINFFGHIFGAQSSEEQGSFIPATLRTVTIAKGSAVVQNAFLGCQYIKDLTIDGNVTFTEGSLLGLDGLEIVRISTFSGSFRRLFYKRVIAEGAEIITFEMPQSLKEVIVTKSATLGNEAFFAAVYLEKIHILPTDVAGNAIGERAFSNCHALKDLKIPDSITSIGESAFVACDSLEAISLPSSVTELGLGVFGYSKNLKSVTIPNGVRDLPSYTFFECISLETVAIPRNLRTIGAEVFRDCRSLKSLDLPSTLQSIDSFCFYNNQALTAINVAEGNPNYESIDGVLFTDSGATLMLYPASKPGDSYTVPYGVIDIAENAFNYNKNLITVQFTADLVTIGRDAFVFSAKLTNLNFAEDGALETIYPMAFDGCDALVTVTLPASLKTLDSRVFYECANLRNVLFAANSSLTKMGSQLFYNCVSLESITIPKSVTEMNGYTFYGCKNLDTVLFEEGSNLKYLGSNTFQGCESLLAIELPEGLEQMGAMVFYKCPYITTIRIPASVKSIGKYLATEATGLREIIVAEENLEYKSVDGVLYTKNGEILMCYPIAKNAATFAVADGTVTIDEFAFAYSRLEEISLPSTLSFIHADAFSGCRDLVKVNLPDSLITIGKSAFVGCEALPEIFIPLSVSMIHGGAFAGCTSLEIYCEAPSQPIAWSSDWKPADTVVHWNAAPPVEDYSALITVSETGVLTGITQAGKARTSLSIPSIVNGITIVKTAPDAFLGCDNLRTLSLPDSLTEITKGTLHTNVPLVQLSIPFSGATKSGAITYIGHIFGASDASENTTVIPGSLTSITLTNAERVAANAFSGLAYVDTVVVNQGTANIGAGAFADCMALKNFVVPASVQSIGSNPFVNCGALESITVADTNPRFKSVDGVLLNKAGTVILCYPGGKPDAVYTMPDTVTTLTKGLFDGAQFTSIVFSSALTRIPEEMFAGNEHIQSYAFQQGSAIEWIGSKAFFASKINRIDIPASMTEIGANAFENCIELATVTFQSGSLLSSIESGAFKGCAKLEEIRLPEKLVTIGNQAFSDCVLLETLLFANDAELTVIGADAFKNCGALLRVVIPASVTDIGENAFSGCVLLASFSFESGANLLTMGADALANCTALTELHLPATLTEINKLFSANVELVSLTIPALNDIFGKLYGAGSAWNQNNAVPASLKTVTVLSGSIPAEAFNGLRNITVVHIASDAVLIGDSAFAGCVSLESVTIGDSITSIGSYAFSNCAALRSVRIPASVQSISGNAFSGCSGMQSYTVDALNSAYQSIDGVLLSKNGAALLAYPKAKPETDYVMPNTVQTVVTGAFSATALTNITLSEALLVIESDLFLNCEALTSVIFPANSVLTAIKANAFKNSGLTAIALPKHVLRIESNAFENCQKLLSVQFLSDDDSMLEEGAGLIVMSNAFKDCILLSDVTFNENLQEFGNNVFSGCAALTTVMLSKNFNKYGFTIFEKSGVHTIDVSADNIAFQAINGVLYSKDGSKLLLCPPAKTTADYAVADGTTHIDAYAFMGSALPSIVLPASLTEIGDRAFNDCVFLEEIVLPDSVTVMGSLIFSGCTELKRVTLPAGITEIASSMFYGCSALTSVTLHAGITSVGASAFTDCTALSAFDFTSIVTIGNSAFKNTGLTDIVFSTALNTIGSNAFEKALQLRTIDFGANAELSIMSRAFLGCSALESLVLPEGVQSLGSSVFADCIALTYIDFTATTALTIGMSTFKGCVALGGLELPEGLTLIDSNAFENCPNLNITNAILPASLTKIAGSAFKNAASAPNLVLQEIYIPITLRAVGADAFSGCTQLTIKMEYAEGAQPGGYSGFTNNWSRGVKAVLWSQPRPSVETGDSISEEETMHFMALKHAGAPSIPNAAATLSITPASVDNGNIRYRFQKNS